MQVAVFDDGIFILNRIGRSEGVIVLWIAALDVERVVSLRPFRQLYLGWRMENRQECAAFISQEIIAVNFLANRSDQMYVISSSHRKICVVVQHKRHLSFSHPLKEQQRLTGST